jgi:sugar phosphate isomerase/epimerase
MLTRRQFLKTSAGAAAFVLPGTDFIGSLFDSFPAPGVQLFTFYNTLDGDTEGTLRQAANAGVVNIESAFSKKGDYYGMSAKQFSQLLNSLGMHWRSHHVFGVPIKIPAGAKDANGNPLTIPPMKNLKENLSEILKDANEGGLQYLVAAHLPIGTKDEIKTSLDILNNSAGPCRKAGIQLVYHNEPADFKNIDGMVPYEVFLTQTDPDLLKFELDVAWAIKGGQSPEKLFERYPGRFPLWHIKDLSKDYSSVLPIGDGTLDHKEYFKFVDKSGLKYYFIEDEASKDPINSISKSIKTIQSISK